jgi:hypothetical protein
MARESKKKSHLKRLLCYHIYYRNAAHHDGIEMDKKKKLQWDTRRFSLSIQGNKLYDTKVMNLPEN